MMLLIDIGNSRIKVGWLDRRSHQREAQALAVAHHEMSILRTWLSTLARTPVAAIGVNVARAALAQQLEDTLGLPIRWIRSSVQAAGVRNSYHTPTQLGADRWLALIGIAAHAAQDPSTPLLLANYGTATTIDTLGAQDEQGVRCFIGGLILPGAGLMRSALAQHTAGLPLAQGSVRAFPDNTDDAIVSGVGAAQAGAMVQQWRQVLLQLRCAPCVYVSGGGWHALAHSVQTALMQAYCDLGLAPAPVQVLNTPVLDGLAHIGQGASAHGLAHAHMRVS